MPLRVDSVDEDAAGVGSSGVTAKPASPAWQAPAHDDEHAATSLPHTPADTLAAPGPGTAPRSRGASVTTPPPPTSDTPATKPADVLTDV